MKTENEICFPKLIDHTLLRPDATRIGTSSGVNIMKETERMKK